MKENLDSELSSSQKEEEEFFDLIVNEDINKIKNILSNKCQIWNFRNKENNNSTVLHISVYHKLFEITKLLIEYCKENNKEGLKKFINEKDDQGVTAIHFASFKGNVKIIKLLIENGADIFIKTKRLLNIIHYSAQGNKPSSIMFYYFELMKKGDFQLIKDKDSGGSTPLHWAAYSNAEDALLYLINLNIFKNEKEKLDFINMKDYQDFTPLHLSVTSKSSRIVMKLLQNGASPEIKNKNQMTPLDLAIKKEQKEIIEIIRNNQSCQICNFKAPVRQIKKSPKNIICVFSFQIISTFLLLVSVISIAFNCVNENGEIHDNIFYNVLFTIYLALLLLFIIIYLLLLINDPGTIKSEPLETVKKLLNNEDCGDLTKYCYKCYVKKTITSKHCIVCNKCYEDFDHHCYWINKCVAGKNFNIFLFFLFETFLYLSVFLYICILGIIHYFQYMDYKAKLVFRLYGLFNINLDNMFIPNFLKKYNIFYFIINILLIVLNLSFLIPEVLLLFIHISVFCSNYREKKRKEKIGRKNISSLAEASILSDTSIEDF